MVQENLSSLQDSSDFSDGISQTIKEIAEWCAIPVNNCNNIHKTRITSSVKPVITQAVSETDIAKQSLKTVCKAVLEYLATKFNDTNMTLLQGLDGWMSCLLIGCHSQNSKPLLTRSTYQKDSAGDGIPQNQEFISATISPEHPKYP